MSRSSKAEDVIFLARRRICRIFQYLCTDFFYVLFLPPCTEAKCVFLIIDAAFYRNEKEKQMHKHLLFWSGCGGGTWTTRPPGYEPDELPTALPRDISRSRLSALILYYFPIILSSEFYKILCKAPGFGVLYLTLCSLFKKYILISDFPANCCFFPLELLQ